MQQQQINQEITDNDYNKSLSLKQQFKKIIPWKLIIAIFTLLVINIYMHFAYASVPVIDVDATTRAAQASGQSLQVLSNAAATAAEKYQAIQTLTKNTDIITKARTLCSLCDKKKLAEYDALLDKSNKSLCDNFAASYQTMNNMKMNIKDLSSILSTFSRDPSGAMAALANMSTRLQADNNQMLSQMQMLQVQQQQKAALQEQKTKAINQGYTDELNNMAKHGVFGTIK